MTVGLSRAELIKIISKKSGYSQRIVDDIVSLFTGAVSQAVLKGHKVSIYKFGVFKLKHRKARSGRNPRTGNTINIPSSYNLAFRPSSVLKARQIQSQQPQETTVS